MTHHKRNLLGAIFEFAVLAAFMAATPAIVALDAEVFLHGSSEVSVTELSQEALILLSASMFALAARLQPGARAWLVLVSGLFACMFIREIDMWLDRIAHGFWVYPALAIALAAVAYAMRHRDTLGSGLAAYTATRAHAYVLTGLLVVVLFSRLFGSGSFWAGVMGDDFRHAYKTFIQEGIELLGYFLIAFGSVSYCRSAKRDGSRPSPAE